MSASPSSHRRFVAFVSYSRLDNMQESRRWAEWIQHSIENYQVPQDMITRRNRNGQITPSSLYPVFRDETELPAASSLTDSLLTALDRSDSLIVICSPRSALSQWVNAEIEHFIASGKARRIIPIVVEGQTNALLENRGSNSECYPKALRGTNFGQTEIHPAHPGPPDQPLFIDFRPSDSIEQGFTNAAAYRHFLQTRATADSPVSRAMLRRAEQGYARQIKRMHLKLIAALLDVDLGEVIRRDSEQRLKRLRRFAVGASALIVAFALITYWAVLNRSRAETAASEAKLLLNARILNDNLSTGGQGAVLQDALRDIDTSQRVLGRVPTETWNLLRASLEASREITSWSLNDQVTGVTVDDSKNVVTVLRQGAIVISSKDGKENERWQPSYEQGECRLTESRNAISRRHNDGFGRTDVYSLNGKFLWGAVDPPEAKFRFVDASRDARVVAYSADDGATVRLLIDGVSHEIAPAGDNEHITHLSVAADGTRCMVVSGEPGNARIVSLTVKPIETIAIGPLPAGRISVEKDLKAFSVLAGNSLTVYRAPNWEAYEFSVNNSEQFKQSEGDAEAVTIGPGGRVLAVTYKNSGTIIVFDNFGAKICGPMLGCDIPTVDFTASGAYLIAGDYNQSKIHIFDVRDRVGVANLDLESAMPGEEAPSALAYISESDCLVWGGSKGTIALVRPGQPPVVLRSLHTDSIESIAPVRRGFATAARDGKAFYVADVSRPFPVPLEWNGQAPYRLVAPGKAGLLVGIVDSHVVVWNPPQTVPISIHGLKDLNDGGEVYVDTMGAAWGVPKIALTTRQKSLEITAIDVGPDPRRQFTAKINPPLLVPWCLAVNGSGDRFLNAGPLDAIMAMDSGGRVIMQNNGVLRPAARGIFWLDDDIYLVGGWDGYRSAEMQVWRLNGERLLPNLADRSLAGPIVGACDPAMRRFWIADARKRIWFFDLSVTALARKGRLVLHQHLVWDE